MQLKKSLIDFLFKAVPTKYMLTDKQTKSILNSFIAKEPTYLPISQRRGMFFHKRQASKNQNSSSLYHLAGDSIVVPCLAAILSQYVNDFDFDNYLNNFYNETLNEVNLCLQKN